MWMKQNIFKIILVISLLIFIQQKKTNAGNPYKLYSSFLPSNKELLFAQNDNLTSDFLGKENNAVLSKSVFATEKKTYSYSFHNDSIHRFNFRYADKKRGLTPYIAPALLITTGTIINFMPDTKKRFRDFAQEHFPYDGNLDEYMIFAPIITVYSLHALGIKGENNFGNVTAIAIKSFMLNAMLTHGLKRWAGEERPGGDLYSFPSGHTSKAFTLAHVLHKEYGEKSPWISIGAYSAATTVGVLRIAKDAHWISDVFAGAGIGILSTELIYLTHQYKWDNEHIKRLDIFPFQVGRQKGLSLVYTF